MIVGGGAIAFYLAKMLIATGIRVKIVEKDMQRCEKLCDSTEGDCRLRGWHGP